MHTATVQLKSASPMCQGRNHHIPKLDKESHADHELRTWKEKGHYLPDGTMFVPAFALKNCLSEAARFLALPKKGSGKATYTKHFEAGVLVLEGMPIQATRDSVQFHGMDVPSDGKRGGSNRVYKQFPIVHEWTGEAVFHVADDTITEPVFRKVLEEAGKFIGLGSFRVRNNGIFGRFSVEKIVWK